MANSYVRKKDRTPTTIKKRILWVVVAKDGSWRWDGIRPTRSAALEVFMAEHRTEPWVWHTHYLNGWRTTPITFITSDVLGAQR